MSKHPKIFTLPVRVYFQDTDAGGVVYHASYVNFMERARTEWMRSFGFSNAGLMKELGVVFVVRSLKLDYLNRLYHRRCVFCNSRIHWYESSY